MASRVLQITAWAAYSVALQWLPESSTRWLGRPSQFLRGLAAKAMLEGCGRGVNIERRARFGSGRTLSVGSRSGVGRASWLVGRIQIGSGVLMGPEVVIFTRNHAFHLSDVPMAEQGYSEERPVRIGDDVWIGARVIILPGVIVGNGAVVGAGAVVSKDVPNRAIVVGNPARVVGVRPAQPTQ